MVTGPFCQRLSKPTCQHIVVTFSGSFWVKILVSVYVVIVLYLTNGFKTLYTQCRKAKVHFNLL